MKEYLGDGVYVDFNGVEIVLTTSDGVDHTNMILLDGEVMGNLLAYYDRLKRDSEK